MKLREYMIQVDERPIGGKLVTIFSSSDFKEAKALWEKTLPDPRAGISTFLVASRMGRRRHLIASNG